jgi:hypothetical protein
MFFLPDLSPAPDRDGHGRTGASKDPRPYRRCPGCGLWWRGYGTRCTYCRQVATTVAGPVRNG